MSIQPGRLPEMSIEETRHGVTQVDVNSAFKNLESIRYELANRKHLQYKRSEFRTRIMTVSENV